MPCTVMGEDDALVSDTATSQFIRHNSPRLDTLPRTFLVCFPRDHTNCMHSQVRLSMLCASAIMIRLHSIGLVHSGARKVLMRYCIIPGL